ncbi:carbohydrate kinase family protein [soil metagenome]
MSQPLDLLALGDITTDTFIRLKEAEVHCEINNEHCTICMSWGDKIPYDSATEVAGVGNAANAAVSAARLGIKAGLFTWTGADNDGNRNKDCLVSEGVDTTYLSQAEGIPSNHDYVLWYLNERTILIKHSQFPYALPENLIAPRYLYLSSLGDPSGATHHAIAAWVKSHPETKLMFQPGQEIGFGRELMAPVYAAAYLCVCNKEEAERVLGHTTSQDVKDLLTQITALGPTVVIITDGLNGAYAYDGTNTYKVPLYPDTRGPFERTGAGDAFASSVATALTLGKPLEEALMWGPVNSMSVVQDVGAQKGLLTRAQIEKYLVDAPAEYKLEIL